MTTINFTSVDSSFIDGVAAHEGGLVVKMKNGSQYRYKDVPPEIVQEFAEAESAGQYYGTNIRGKFEGSPIEDDDHAGTG